MRTSYPRRVVVAARYQEPGLFAQFDPNRAERLAVFFRVSIAGLALCVATMAYAAFV
jgi:hypothetical protein